MTPDLSVALLHENMLDKHGRIITASLTLIDVHDIARSARTYGLRHVFIAHPSEALRKLTLTLRTHWQEGFGSTYNPNRKDALSIVQVLTSLDESIALLTEQTGKPPRLIATSARDGGQRLSFPQMRKVMESSPDSFLLMLGTGWGMTEELLSKAEFFLDPLKGPGDYNHLSVRSACAVMLDRLMSPAHQGSPAQP